MVIAGLANGKVKAMTDENGKRVKEAGPSTPVTVLGLSEVPPAGERFTTTKDEQRGAPSRPRHGARQLEAAGAATTGVTLESLFGEIHRGGVHDFNIVLKTDVQGSIEPLVRALEDASIEGVNVKVIHASAGTINESDVNLAVASKGVIIGFNTDARAGRTAPSRKRRRRDPRVPRHLRHHR